MIKKRGWVIKTFGISHPVANMAPAVLAPVASSVVLSSEAEAHGGQIGPVLFHRQCSGCHALYDDHEGPRLEGVVGRAAGAVKVFQYSKALKNAQRMSGQGTRDEWPRPEHWGHVFAAHGESGGSRDIRRAFGTRSHSNCRAL